MSAQIIYSGESQTWLKITSARIILPKSDEPSNDTIFDA
jgi:hypothetical protein